MTPEEWRVAACLASDCGAGVCGGVLGRGRGFWRQISGTLSLVGEHWGGGGEDPTIKQVGARGDNSHSSSHIGRRSTVGCKMLEVQTFLEY